MGAGIRHSPAKGVTRWHQRAKAGGFMHAQDSPQKPRISLELPGETRLSGSDGTRGLGLRDDGDKATTGSHMNGFRIFALGGASHEPPPRHPVLRWMASSVAVETDAAGNLKPSKKKSIERIDGIVAGIMALGRTLLRREHTSVYDARDLLVL